LSVFAKKGTNNWILLNSNNYDGSTDGYAFFDLENGALGTAVNLYSSDISDFGNGWYRVSITVLLGASNTVFDSQIFIADADNDNTLTLDGNNSIYIWGAQLEQGNISSYIPTEGSQTTRNSDLCNSLNISSLLGQTEGTIFLDFKVLSENTVNANIFNTNKNTTNSIAVIRTRSTQKISVQTFFNSVNVNYLSTNTYSVGDRIKLAFKYKNGDVKLYINGTLENSATPTFTISSALSEINLADNVTYFARKEAIGFTALAVWKEALSDAELTELTTI
tara:strand:+ start:960 stop:1793 length:834 start_codon:yes stop_codon:yes gene_type:complete